MSVQTPTVKHENSITVPKIVVEQIAEQVERRDAPTDDDVRDLAFGHVEQRTEFVTESGESLTDAVADRLDE